ncbi:MAG: ATP synthase subunit C [Oscillospiraceae bacterium]|jgi:V/A-type H+-transporting ATPase subunit K|nr:ATP synthase subunit C [Oscillospiraceae bacterium]
MEILLTVFPAVFLVLSVFISFCAVRFGSNPKKVLIKQISSFALVIVLYFLLPIATFAQGADATSSSGTAFGVGKGLVAIGSALSIGLCGLGSGIAVSASVPAAIGATSEDPKMFAKSLIFVALGEAIALYGIVISFMLAAKI